jgi:xylulokinase
VEAVLASVAGLLTGYGVECNTVLLIGGGARSEAIRAVAVGIFGVPVDVPEPEEYAALGAACQAAWAPAGTPEPRRGPAGPSSVTKAPRSPASSNVSRRCETPPPSGKKG